MDIFQKNSTKGLNYGLSSAYPLVLWSATFGKTSVTLNFISFEPEMFRSKAIQVLSVYYSDVLNTLKNGRLSENFRWVLPWSEGRFKSIKTENFFQWFVSNRSLSFSLYLLMLAWQSDTILNDKKKMNLSGFAYSVRTFLCVLTQIIDVLNTLKNGH